MDGCHPEFGRPRSNPKPAPGSYMQNKETQLYSKWFKAATRRVRKRFTFAETVYLFKSRKAARDVESKMKGFVLVSHSRREPALGLAFQTGPAAPAGDLFQTKRNGCSLPFEISPRSRETRQQWEPYCDHVL